MEHLAKDLTVLGRLVEVQPRGNGRTAKMRILLSSDHGKLVRADLALTPLTQSSAGAAAYQTNRDVASVLPSVPGFL
jgi:hypothetical protein